MKWCTVQWALKGGVTTTASETELRCTGTCGFRLVARGRQYAGKHAGKYPRKPGWLLPLELLCLAVFQATILYVVISMFCTACHAHAPQPDVV